MPMTSWGDFVFEREGAGEVGGEWAGRDGVGFGQAEHPVQHLEEVAEEEDAACAVEAPDPASLQVRVRMDLFRRAATAEDKLLPFAVVGGAHFGRVWLHLVSPDGGYVDLPILVLLVQVQRGLQ
ncbi:hypothetical protein OPT61_g9713 [Boeremia exigua]|uniref:Uncharacterized protein n=1 Tax=Boeremia exigua TaxID=749465 RepID=A0ACC2HSW1_9PLEO|nr:hypothetical protein OPT61_g9713 [Boeremia exigua]